MSRKLTTEQFVETARAVHGVGTYDYSQTVYSGRQQNIKIICPTHGAFMQKPAAHNRGSGCPACGSARIKASLSSTTQDFILKARAVHGERYDYSRVEYAGSKVKVDILCLAHGLFSQSPNGHISKGAGCPKCKGTRLSQIQRGTTQDFIARAQAKHGVGTYDYSQTVYSRRDDKVIIICAQHGEFSQAAGAHLSGSGCPACGFEKVANTIADSPQDFILKARAVHGERYDYSRVEYTRGYTGKVQIICDLHGSFKQVRAIHLTGQGCPKCGKIKRNEGSGKTWVEQAGGRSATLYFLRIWGAGEEFYKVGITLHSVAWRYRALGALASYSYEVIVQHSSSASRIYDWEQSILETFAHLHYKPRQHFGGASECFSSADEILAIFPL